MTKMKALYLGDLRTECIHESGSRLLTDAPKDNHGKGEAFSPTDLFAASLATCMLTLMGIAARSSSFDLKGSTIDIEKEMTQSPKRRIGKLRICFRSSHRPEDLLRKRLEQAAMECPVHHSLHPDIQLEFDFIWGD